MEKEITKYIIGFNQAYLLAKYKPELIILDLDMPQKSGLESLKEIIRDYPDARVIVLLGDHETSSIKRAFQLGAQGFIYKPFRFQTLQKKNFFQFEVQGS